MIGPRPLVPADFAVPEVAGTDRFVLRPLTWEAFPGHHEACRSCIEHLRAAHRSAASLGPDGSTWPQGTSAEMAALISAWAEMEAQVWRSSFTYVVLEAEPGSDRQLGAAYLYPSTRGGFQVEAHVWSRDAQDVGDRFDEALHDWFRGWVAQVWPFEPAAVAWPGRAIDWEQWFALPERPPEAVWSRAPVDAAISG